MSVSIEPMTDSDVEFAATLRMSAFFAGSGRTLEQDMAGLRGLLSGGDGLEASLVARLGGEIAGSVLLVRNELDARHDLGPWLAGLVVAPGARGRGIGTALVRAVEAHGRALGVENLYLYTWAASRFYELLGWHAVETFHCDGEPEMLMARRLL